MTASPNEPHPHNPAGPFANLGAGLGFLQDWLKAAGSALPHLQGANTSPGAMPAWNMPTLDPQELDKRIQDLRTVQFWLEQNARMIAMTIQGLEVQKMTLSTLQGMNVSMDAVRDALRSREAPTTPPQAASQSKAQAAPPDPAAQPDLVNPLRWWDTLTQQFTHLAAQTAQTAQTMGETMRHSTTEPPRQRPAGKATGRAAPARKKAAAPAPRASGGRGRTKPDAG